jgi:hypothetical protein
MMNSVLNFLSQYFCKHHWIWRSQALECSHCLKQHQLHPSLVYASGPFTAQARTLARQRLANVLEQG